MPDKESDRDKSDMGRNLAHGMEVAVGVGLGYLVGNWFDNRFGTKPWGLFVCILLGCAAGMYLLIKEGIQQDRPSDKNQADKKK